MKVIFGNLKIGEFFIILGGDMLRQKISEERARGFYEGKTLEAIKVFTETEVEIILF